MRKVIGLIAFLLSVSSWLFAATPDEVKKIAQKGSFTKRIEEIFLWPGKAPGSENLVFDEMVEDLSKDPEWKTRRITLVTKPSITGFFPDKPNGIAVLIAPGGGYTRIGFDDEGTDIAKWLNSLGITGFVLKYRFPDDGHENGKDVPLQDAQRAVRLIRQNASSWGIDSKRVGAMGFSAGGHLAAMIGTCYNVTVYNQIDKADSLSARPDFLALIYPVISNFDDLPPKEFYEATDSQMQKMFLRYQPNTRVTKETPGAFILLADDDRFGLQQHGPRFYRALRKEGVASELHVFLNGNHGFGVRRPVGAVADWTNMFVVWLKNIGIGR